VKAIVRCLEAVERGATISLEVSEDTGIALAEASKWLGDLAKDGLIERLDRPFFHHERRRHFIQYAAR
jgi:DNA-binding MarR family transcriptional regulator